MAKLVRSRTDKLSYLALVLVALTTVACTHRPKNLEPAATETVAETRGLCPTDLNHSQMIVRDGSDVIAVGFRTRDPSRVEEMSERAAEIGEALAAVHPAVNASGELVQHTPAPKPDLRELADGTGYGVELLFRPEPERKSVLLANLNDHERMWNRGECPVMSDQSVKHHETKNWPRVDR